MTTYYTNRANAIRAARKAIDANAQPGLDFTITTHPDGRFSIGPIEKPAVSATAGVADTEAAPAAATPGALDELAQEAPSDDQLLTDADPETVPAEIQAALAPYAGLSEPELVAKLETEAAAGDQGAYHAALALKTASGQTEAPVDLTKLTKAQRKAYVATGALPETEAAKDAQVTTDILDMLLADVQAGTLDQPVLAKPKKPKAAKPPKGPSASALKAQATAEAIAKGELPPALVIVSAANQHYQHRADALRELAEAGKLNALLVAEVKGVNTYSKMLVRYRDQCIAALKARKAAAPKAKGGKGSKPENHATHH
jgi:hypothetical protein